MRTCIGALLVIVSISSCSTYTAGPGHIEGKGGVRLSLSPDEQIVRGWAGTVVTLSLENTTDTTVTIAVDLDGATDEGPLFNLTDPRGDPVILRSREVQHRRTDLHAHAVTLKAGDSLVREVRIRDLLGQPRPEHGGRYALSASVRVRWRGGGTTLATGKVGVTLEEP